MRDLKAELSKWARERIRQDRLELADDVVEEAINRAIAAEGKLAQGMAEDTVMIHIFECDHVWRNDKVPANCPVCELTEENARLTAQVAGMRDALEFYSNKNHWPDGPAVYPGGTPIPPIMKDNGARARQVLVSPDPGEKYRKVVEAAWTVFKTNGMSGILISDLGKALAELEGRA